MAVEDEVTEEMPFEPVGLHQGCGGEVRLIWAHDGGFELCLLCGETASRQDPTDLIEIEWEVGFSIEENQALFATPNLSEQTHRR